MYGYKGTSEETLKDLQIRINSLHEHGWYSSEQEQIKRLLCGYHMRRATVARDTGYDKGALVHYNSAVFLATENNYTDLAAAALFRRGEFYFHRWELQKALRDFQAAERSTLAPPDVLGRIASVKGVTLARMARTERDMITAMGAVNQSKGFIRPDMQEEACMIDFPQTIFTLNYIKSLLGSPVSKLRRPNEANDLITTSNLFRETLQPGLRRYDLIQDKLLTVLIYIDKGYYPVATTQLQDALKFIEKGYLIYLPIVVRAYESLLESPYGKSTEVAELGLQLLSVQMPHLFKN